MQQSRLIAFISQHGACFSAGEIEAVAAHYQVPFGLYLEGDLSIVGSEAKLHGLLLTYRRRLASLGVVRVEPAFRHMEIGAERASVDVVWRHLMRTGRCLGTSSVRYFLGPTADRRQLIQMVEYLRRPTPILQVRRTLQRAR